MDIEAAYVKAEYYSHSQGRTLRRTLMGFGQDGFLWATLQDSVVKVFERQANYDRELKCYQRLLDHNVTRISIFDVPRLIGYSDLLHVVEMSVVSPPHLLDFGKAYVDVPPQFSEETMRDWDEGLTELFGERVAEVKSALRSLEVLGIYYLDARPGNIMF
jgi:hypothetical protein